MIPEWSTACLDWESRIIERRSLIAFPPLFEDEAKAALAVFKSLRMVDVAGSPTFGEACDVWVFDFVAAIFGAYDNRSAKRLIKEFFLLISKKNGKSTIAAAIMLTALIRNWRLSAELMILAPTIEIANNSFKPAADMVRADEKLSSLLHIQEHLRQITHRTTNAILKVVAGDTDTVGGKKSVFVLVDELWLFGKRANADSMLREATGGLIARPEGFVIYLSTHSDEPPAGVFKSKLDYYRDIRDGKVIDNKKLGVLYEFPDSYLNDNAKPYLEPENFYITNPNIGRSVDEEWLTDKLNEAMAGDVGALRVFLAKHLNVEIGQNIRSNRWPGSEYWEGALDEELSALDHFEKLDRLVERSEAVVVGIDGGGLDDLFGFSALGREPFEILSEIEFNGHTIKQALKPWLLWSHGFCHRSTLSRRPKITSVLQDFEKSGELTVVNDQLGDIAAIISIIERLKASGKLVGVSVDPAGLSDFEDALKEIDITVENGLLVGAKQGFGMMNAIKSAERRLVSGLLKHGGESLMAWCVGNLKIEPTATAIRATKQNAGDAKIDVAMAMFDAVTHMCTNPAPPRKADYQMIVL